jgi:glycosyltransferase involved in cell wall biosynthesis
MKILFLEQFSEPGGGQRNLLDLLPAVMDRGWKAVVAAPGSGPLLESARRLGAETERISLGSYSAGRKTAGDAARFVIDTIALGRWISRQDCDVISAGGARLMPAVARGARGVRAAHTRPVIFQAQHYLGKSYAVALAARAIRSSNATVIANSEHVASQYKSLIDSPVRVVYNGTAELPFAERKRERALRIGIVGRIAPMKGQTDFLRAAAQIAPHAPETKFVVCGSPMFTRQAYVDEVHRLADGLPVEFLGWRDDVGHVLAGLDLLIAPSTAAEATTRVILEACSAGVPVVAYANGGIPEIVRDGDNGFLVPECEPAALARKILAVAKMDLRPLALRARADWERRFTLDRYQCEMTDAISQVIRARETTSERLRSASG